MARCFEGVRLALDLGYSMPLVEKTRFRLALEAQGALIDLVFGEMSDCLVVTEEKLKGALTYKVEKAKNQFKPVVTNTYLSDAMAIGRAVDAKVMALDGHVNPPRLSQAEDLADAEASVLPSINTAVAAIQAVLAADYHVPQDSLDKLKRPVWMPHLSSLFSKFVPDPSRYVYEPVPDVLVEEVDPSGPFSMERLRLEREAQNRAQMEEKARLKEKEERDHVLKLEERIAREALAREEELRSKPFPKPVLPVPTSKLAPRVRPTTPTPAPRKPVAEATKSSERKMTQQKSSPPPKASKPDPCAWTTVGPKCQPGALKVLPQVGTAFPPLLSAPSKTGKKEKAPPKAPTDVGLKIFIGGLKFDDITKKATEEKWEASKVSAIKTQRISELKKIVASLGSVTQWQDAWDEGYAFATFSTKEDAERAMKTLSVFDHRKGLCKQSKARLQTEGRDKLSVPSHSFYVRWPKFYQRIVEKNKERKAEASHKHAPKANNSAEEAQSISPAI